MSIQHLNVVHLNTALIRKALWHHPAIINVKTKSEFVSNDYRLTLLLPFQSSKTLHEGRYCKWWRPGTSKSLFINFYSESEVKILRVQFSQFMVLVLYPISCSTTKSYSFKTHLKTIRQLTEWVIGFSQTDFRRLKIVSVHSLDLITN